MLRPQFSYELFIYDIIMGKKFGSITAVPSLDIFIYQKYIEKYISIYQVKGQLLRPPPKKNHNKTIYKDFKKNVEM